MRKADVLCLVPLARERDDTVTFVVHAATQVRQTSLSANRGARETRTMANNVRE